MTQDSQNSGTLVPATMPAPELDDSTLKALGLVRDDLPRIAEIGRELEDLRPGNLQVFGREAAARTTAFSSQLLDQVRNRDLDANGEKLGEVVRIARELKLDGFSQRSKVPLIGGLIDRLRSSKGELVQKFSDTNSQIEQLLGDVGAQQALMGKRVSDFDRMHDIVREERHALGLYAAAGKQRLAQLQSEQLLGQGSDDPPDPGQCAAADREVQHRPRHHHPLVEAPVRDPVVAGRTEERRRTGQCHRRCDQ